MIDELQAAAARLANGDYGSHPLKQVAIDGQRVAEAYLAEHPADDGKWYLIPNDEGNLPVILTSQFKAKLQIFLKSEFGFSDDFALRLATEMCERVQAT